jgi:hypothetical protein
MHSVVSLNRFTMLLDLNVHSTGLCYIRSTPYRRWSQTKGTDQNIASQFQGSVNLLAHVRIEASGLYVTTSREVSRSLHGCGRALYIAQTDLLSSRTGSIPVSNVCQVDSRCVVHLPFLVIYPFLSSKDGRPIPAQEGARSECKIL